MIIGTFEYHRKQYDEFAETLDRLRGRDIAAAKLAAHLMLHHLQAMYLLTIRRGR